ncbi:MAG: hypothetical protein ACIAXF_07445 [Phycisphaerales bacterium JB063]
MDKMSLLPKSYAAHAATRRAKRVWVVASAASLSVSACAIGWSAMRSGPSNHGRYAEQVALAERRADESKQEALVLGTRLGQNRHALSAIDAVAGQPDWKTFLERISLELGDQVLLTSCRFGPLVEPSAQQAAGLKGDALNSSWLLLGGYVDTYPEVPSLLLRLEGIGLFQKVVLIETRSESFGGKPRIGFRIACRAQ